MAQGGAWGRSLSGSGLLSRATPGRSGADSGAHHVVAHAAVPGGRWAPAGRRRFREPVRLPGPGPCRVGPLDGADTGRARGTSRRARRADQREGGGPGVTLVDRQQPLRSPASGRSTRSPGAAGSRRGVDADRRAANRVAVCSSMSRRGPHSNRPKATGCGGSRSSGGGSGGLPTGPPSADTPSSADRSGPAAGRPAGSRAGSASPGSAAPRGRRPRASRTACRTCR